MSTNSNTQPRIVSREQWLVERKKHLAHEKELTKQLDQKGEAHFTLGESHGLSVFLRDNDSIFHTYSAYARGLELLDGTYNYLDLTPFGRQEDWEDSPQGWPQTPTYGWLRHHDKYDDSNKDSTSCCNSGS